MPHYCKSCSIVSVEIDNIYCERCIENIMEWLDYERDMQLEESNRIRAIAHIYRNEDMRELFHLELEVDGTYIQKLLNKEEDINYGLQF